MWVNLGLRRLPVRSLYPPPALLLSAKQNRARGQSKKALKRAAWIDAHAVRSVRRNTITVQAESGLWV